MLSVPVGHGGHGLRASHGEYAVHAAKVGGVKYLRGDGPFARGRRAEDHLSASGDPCRDGEHQHRGEERRLAARNVQPHAADRHGTLHAADTGHRLDAHLLRQLGAVEGLDVGFGRGERFFQVVGDRLRGLAADVGRNFECLRCAALDAADDAA